jgi:hypothetical protein
VSCLAAQSPGSKRWPTHGSVTKALPDVSYNERPLEMAKVPREPEGAGRAGRWAASSLWKMSEEHSIPAILFLTRVQFVECALQLFQLLSSLAELAFRGQALIVGKVFGRFRN